MQNLVVGTRLRNREMKKNLLNEENWGHVTNHILVKFLWRLHFCSWRSWFGNLWVGTWPILNPATETSSENGLRFEVVFPGDL